jgi:hypothetical protein
VNFAERSPRANTEVFDQLMQRDTGPLRSLEMKSNAGHGQNDSIGFGRHQQLDHIATVATVNQKAAVWCQYAAGVVQLRQSQQASINQRSWHIVIALRLAAHGHHLLRQ